MPFQLASCSQHHHAHTYMLMPDTLCGCDLQALSDYHVLLEGTLLKPNMVRILTFVLPVHQPLVASSATKHTDTSRNYAWSAPGICFQPHCSELAINELEPHGVHGIPQVTPGVEGKKASPQEIGAATVKSLMRNVPPAVPGENEWAAASTIRVEAVMVWRSAPPP